MGSMNTLLPLEKNAFFPYVEVILSIWDAYVQVSIICFVQIFSSTPWNFFIHLLLTTCLSLPLNLINNLLAFFYLFVLFLLQKVNQHHFMYQWFQLKCQLFSWLLTEHLPVFLLCFNKGSDLNGEEPCLNWLSNSHEHKASETPQWVCGWSVFSQTHVARTGLSPVPLLQGLQVPFCCVKGCSFWRHSWSWKDFKGGKNSVRTLGKVTSLCFLPSQV